MKAKKGTPTAPAFITLGDYDEFQRPDRFIPRTLTEAPLESGRQTPRQLPFEFHLRSQLRELVSKDATSFLCTCVTVRDGDGMSWSAEAANALLLKDYPQFKRWCFTAKVTTDSLPVIADFIGLRRFLGLAASHGMTKSPFSFLTLRPWMTPLIFGLMVVVGSIAQASGVIQKTLFSSPTQTVGQLLSNWSFWFVNAVLALLGVASQTIAAKKATNPKSAAIDKLVQKLSSNEVLQDGDLKFDAFVNSLARQLQSVDFPRVVVIDNFENLDQTTRRVIEYYFQKYSETRRGSEFWIVFQREDGARFSNLVLQHPASEGFRKVQFFVQAVLTDEEREKLVRITNGPEEALQYVSVKRISRAQSPTDGNVQTFFRNYRADHPKKTTYGPLDFLFLMSLTADTVSLTQKFMLKNLPVKGGMRAEVLNQFLYGTNLRVEEFRDAWSKIQERFKAMLIVEPDADATRLRVVPEKTDVLESMAEELELPNPKLGHLFWSLFWVDKLQNHPIQAVWIRKLTEHLLKARALEIQDEQKYVAVLNRLFDALLFAVDGSLKTCLFRHVPQLLETAHELLIGDLARTDVDNKRLFRLLAKCWEAYSVLGQEQILRLILDIHETTGPEAKVEVPEDRRLLERLFFESISLAPEKRRLLKANLFGGSTAPAETSEAMSDYACTRAAWLTFVSAHRLDSDVNKFKTALMHSDAAIDKIAKRASDRLEHPTENSIGLMDITTLSLTLWCRALRFNGRVMYSIFDGANPFSLGLTPDDPEFLAKVAALSQSLPDFSAVIEAAEDAVLLASLLTKRAAGAASATGTDYLLNALAKELCAMSLASILLANSYSRGATAGEAEITRINDVIRISNDFLEYSLPLVSQPEDLSSPELLDKVESLMKLSGIIWNEFGLERLRDFINIRRIHFDAVCHEPGSDTFPAYNSLVNSLGAILNETDFGGIMANLAISDSLISSEELAAYYLIHAAELGLASTFGHNLRNQLCLAAILESHLYAYNIDPFIKHIIAERRDLVSLLQRFLKSLPENALEPAMLKLTNASKRATEPEDGAKILQVLTTFAKTISTPQVKANVEALLNAFSTEDSIRKGDSIDVPGLLKFWEDKKSLWLYPGILSTLLRSGYDTKEIRNEALTILNGRDASLDEYNTYWLLSISLALRQLRDKAVNGDRQISVSYLKFGIEKWKAHSPAGTNVRAFELLYQLDPENQSHYLAEVQKWKVIEIEGDHLKLLPRLLKSGQLFLVFQYYFQASEFWGLQTDLPPADLNAQLHVVPEEKRKRVKEWKASGGKAPQPFVHSQNRVLLSSQFLTLGSYLFSAPNHQDSTLDRDRELFNEAAAKKIPELFKAIVGLPQLPATIKDLMRSHAERLAKYTLPQD